jgi:hypothetical protein
VVDEKFSNEFEEQVREGLQRCEPPAGFADGVIQRVADETKLRVMPARSRNYSGKWGVRQWAVAAALLVAVGGGVLEQRHIEERRQQVAAEQARAQLMTALQITSTQLQRVDREINQQE